MQLPDPSETIFHDWPPLKRLRRRLISPLFRMADTGLPGLTPLRTHILICGYPRGGTTLLLAMMEYAMPEARRFKGEACGWRAATWSWRNHSVVISKMPKDILRLHRLRNFYRGRRARLRAIVVLRDPRDVLTSHHVLKERRYFLDIGEWRVLHEHCRAQKVEPDVMMVRYEDLLADVPAMQKRIEEFTGEKILRPFEEFYRQDAGDFDIRPLNGLRPVDRSGIGRWRASEHRDRIEEILRDVPDFPEILVELGYEPDASWIERWRKSGAEEGHSNSSYKATC